jgi:hypothetical protein
MIIINKSYFSSFDSAFKKDRFPQAKQKRPSPFLFSNPAFLSQEIIEPLFFRYLFEFLLLTFRDREALLEIIQPGQP